MTPTAPIPASGAGRSSTAASSSGRPGAASGGGMPPMPVWPLFASLGPLGALPTAARLARTFTVLVLAGWDLSALADDGEIITAELAANVIQAATAPDGQPRYDDQGRLPVFWLRLLSDQRQLHIETWDNLPAGLGDPAPRRARPDEESGRGLDMVRELSLDWGWDHLPGSGTKRVWALLATTQPRPSGARRA